MDLRPTESHKRFSSAERSLTMANFVIMIFYSVSGGPFGIEEAVSAAGPRMTFGYFFLFVVVWSIPEILVTTELATTFPTNAGHSGYVCAAMGPFLGYMNGYISTLGGFVDNSIYPHLVIQYFLPERYVELKFVFLIVMTIILTVVNYRGLEIVGGVSRLLALLTSIPFVVMALLAIPKFSPSNLDYHNKDKVVDYALLLNILFWKLNYWNTGASLAGEVKDPHKIIPQGILLAFSVVLVGHLIPLTVALGVEVHCEQFDKWKAGELVTTARSIGGNYLALWIMAAAVASSIGQFETQMSSSTFSVQGMAELGWLPSICAIKSKYGTPIVGTILAVVSTVYFLRFKFEEIVMVTNSLYCMSVSLQFLSFWILRMKRPDLKRPFKVKLGTIGSLALITPPLMVSFYIINRPIYDLNMVHGWHMFSVLVFGIGSYFGLAIARNIRMFIFLREAPQTPEDVLKPDVEAKTIVTEGKGSYTNYTNYTML